MTTKKDNYSDRGRKICYDMSTSEATLWRKMANVGGTKRTFISAVLSSRLCPTGTCCRLFADGLQIVVALFEEQEYDMENLLSLLEREFTKVRNESQIEEKEELCDITSSNRKSKNVLKKLVDDKNVNMTQKESPMYYLSKGRASHSILNYLLGRAFSPFGELYSNIEQVLDEVAGDDALKVISMSTQSIAEKRRRDRLWMLVALYHDIGYFQDAIADEHFDYNSYTYQLYTDDVNGGEKYAEIKNYSQRYPKNMAYRYSEILAYDKYDRERRKNMCNLDDERINHGIFGGAYLFNHLMNKSDNMDEVLLIKSVCMCIAQHNIFKSSKEEDDKKYCEYKLKKLCSNSSFAIDGKYPLLLFLSLVDTIECVKRFSRSCNGKKYFQTKTVLSSVSVGVSENKIELDYSELLQRILEKYNLQKDTKLPLLDTYEAYVESISGSVTEGGKGVAAWTSFRTQVIETREVNGKGIPIKINITMQNKM